MTQVPPNCIKFLRGVRGLTQMKLASLAHMHRSRLEQIENFKRMPKLDEAQRIAAILDCALDVVFPTSADGDAVPSLQRDMHPATDI